MTAVVAVHGIAQEYKGPESLRDEWEPAMIDGIHAAGGQLSRGHLACAFYGSLFRPKGFRRSGRVHYEAADLDADDAALLEVLWRSAAETEPDRVVSPDAGDLRAGTPRLVQAGLLALSNSRAFAGLAESAFIGALKQVTLYLRDPSVRTAAQDTVDAVVTTETRTLVGHSLGSVVAYESLLRFHSSPRWANVRTLVTLGSPLGIPNIIFDRLQPPPRSGRATHPGTSAWVNVSDDGDVVALQKRLKPLFGSPLDDIGISNGANSHDVKPYLTAAETGRAIADGLA